MRRRPQGQHAPVSVLMFFGMIVSSAAVMPSRTACLSPMIRNPTLSEHGGGSGPTRRRAGSAGELGDAVHDLGRRPPFPRNGYGVQELTEAVPVHQHPRIEDDAGQHHVGGMRPSRRTGPRPACRPLRRGSRTWSSIHTTCSPKADGKAGSATNSAPCRCAHPASPAIEAHPRTT